MKRLAVYAHWDPQGRVKKYVRHTLEQLRKDCDRVHFLSTGKLQPAEIDRVRLLCDAVGERENAGYDFAMWREALLSEDLDAWDEVVIVNSSVIGPVFPLAPLFERMAKTNCDFWGMTECTIWTPHVQSYFLVFRSRLLRSSAFLEFWRAVLPFREKMQVVRSYELGLTHWFSDQGFRHEALVRYDELARKVRANELDALFGWRYGASRFVRAWQTRSEPQNPTYLWPMELLSLGMPFVKYELFRDNHRGFPHERVYALLEAAGYRRDLLSDAG